MIGVVLVSLLACSPFLISLGVQLWKAWKETQKMVEYDKRKRRKH